MELILIQILGFIALGVGMLSHQFSNPRHTMAALVVSESLWAIHYFTMGALAGCLITALNSIKFGISAKFGDRSMYITITIYLALIWSGFFYFNGGSSALILVAGSTLGTMGLFLRDKPQLFRIAMLISAFPWVYYSYHIGSISSLIDDSCIVLSICVGILRHSYISPKITRPALS